MSIRTWYSLPLGLSWAALIKVNCNTVCIIQAQSCINNREIVVPKGTILILNSLHLISSAITPPQNNLGILQRPIQAEVGSKSIPFLSSSSRKKGASSILPSSSTQTGLLIASLSMAPWMMISMDSSFGPNMFSSMYLTTYLQGEVA